MKVKFIDATPEVIVEWARCLSNYTIQDVADACNEVMEMELQRFQVLATITKICKRVSADRKRKRESQALLRNPSLRITNRQTHRQLTSDEMHAKELKAMQYMREWHRKLDCESRGIEFRDCLNDYQKAVFDEQEAEQEVA